MVIPKDSYKIFTKVLLENQYFIYHGNFVIRVKKRFPDLQHLVDAGLMRDDELKATVHKQIFKIVLINKFGMEMFDI